MKDVRNTLRILGLSTMIAGALGALGGFAMHAPAAGLLPHGGPLLMHQRTDVAPVSVQHDECTAAHNARIRQAARTGETLITKVGA